MKKIIFIVLAVPLMYSCAVFHKQGNMLPEISEIESCDSCISYNMMFLFKTENVNEIAYVKIWNLIKEYRNTTIKEECSFQAYIAAIKDNKITMQCSTWVHCFHLNDSIATLYNNNTFSDFLNFTTDTLADGRYWMKNNLYDEQAIYTVMYYMSLNNHFCYSDDYIGRWHCDYIVNFDEQIEQIAPCSL
jgi:hypothetical protein